MFVLGLNLRFHDSSAVLVDDDGVIAGVEEERLFRVRHTTELPVRAALACVRQAERSRRDFHGVDLVAISLSEKLRARQLQQEAEAGRRPVPASPIVEAAEVLRAAGLAVESDQIRMVPHHVSHAASAFLCSGFDEALVLTLDGIGDEDDGMCSGLLARAKGLELERLRSVAVPDSLGWLYTDVTRAVGFLRFDEYKLMGLAPYGDPARFRSVFSERFRLLDDGWFELDRDGLKSRLAEIVPARSASDGLSQVHEDVAASCQETLEIIVLHVLRAARDRTGLSRLAMAGGVALNCAMNGKILASGLFDDVFVQPAAADSGCALGAALWVSHQHARARTPRPRLDSVFWGTPTPPGDEIENALEGWRDHLEFERLDDVVERAAEELARGRILGWVQGRSEFGPRALGNRSILADPRPASNRAIVNAMVKKREAFRPFAPSVQEERVREYFDVPGQRDSFPFMLFLLSVRPEWRERLAATTHADGTARVHTVDREIHPRFWALLEAFGARTGVHVLLNTSFNDSAEPIVDSVEDAIVCLLTTGLDRLAVGDFWVRKREPSDASIAGLIPAPVPGATWTEIDGPGGGRRGFARYRSFELSKETGLVVGGPTLALLRRMDGRTRLGALLDAVPGEAERSRCLAEVRELWWRRMLRMAPRPAA